MAERLKAAVLKTEVGNTTVGSNPTPSANFAQGLAIAPGRTYAGAVEEFEASATFRGMTGAVTRPRAWLITTKRAFDSHSRNQFLGNAKSGD